MRAIGWRHVAVCLALWMPTVAAAPAGMDCFHEKQQIQFAPAGSPFGRDGLIVHDGADFGDTAQREGWYWLGVWIRQNRLHKPWADNPPRVLTFDAVLKKLEPAGDGVFVRAPGKDPFGRAADGHINHGTTRDQLVPLIAAMAVRGKHAELQRLWEALPEDILGKHDFQGHWHDSMDGGDSFTADPCAEIRNHRCSQSDAVARAACMAQKAADLNTCQTKKLSGVLRFTGDPLPPMAYNLFVRAGVNPTGISPVTRKAVSADGFTAGEVYLKGSIDVLRHQATGEVPCGSQSVPDKLDCVDQDMNTMVMLWMSRYTRSTAISEAAIASYRSRAHSYGSYFGAYCAAFGPLATKERCASGDRTCCEDKRCLNDLLFDRMKAGIATGWAPDGAGIGPYGAVRWYQRWTTGANPGLAVLWEPIFQDVLK
jgi:hypothetical protein